MRRRAWITQLSAASLGCWLAACAAEKHDLSPEFKSEVDALQQKSRHAVEQAEAIQKAQGPPPKPGSTTKLKPGEPIWIQSGTSRVLDLSSPVERVSLSDPDIAGIVVLGPRSLMINAKPLPPEQQQEESGIQIGRTGTYLGRTLTPPPRIAQTTLTLWGSHGIEAHEILIADFIDRQVMLDVIVAEVNRTAMEEHGIDFRVLQNDLILWGTMGASGAPQILTTVPPQQNQPLLPLTVTGERPTYSLIFPKQDVGFFLQLLQTEGLATILAQPKLLALSGQNAAFQVGGEIPIRIATGFIADVEFKPFGTIVNFLPRVSEQGDILLTVTPEVSEPDFSRTVEGIPTFRTRRASTSAQLESGQLLLLGGLLQTKVTEVESGVPYLKDVPYLGFLFKQTSFVKEETELVVVARATIVQAIPEGVDLPLPTDRGPLTREEVRTQPEPDAVTRPRLP